MSKIETLGKSRQNASPWREAAEMPGHVRAAYYSILNVLPEQPDWQFVNFQYKPDISVDFRLFSSDAPQVTEEDRFRINRDSTQLDLVTIGRKINPVTIAPDGGAITLLQPRIWGFHPGVIKGVFLRRDEESAPDKTNNHNLIASISLFPIPPR